MRRTRITAALRCMAAGAVLAVLAGAGTASAVGSPPKPDPLAAPPTVHGKEAPTVAEAGSRPVSGKSPKASPLSRNSAPGGFQRVISQKVQLKNTVTDADGDKSTLTFEVWTADASGNPVTQVNLTDANPYGVLVSAYVASGSTATVDVPAGKLSLNKNYVFHTNAFDGSLYETTWSPWAKFRVEMPVDLTLPTPDYTAPDPSSLNTPPDFYQTKPLGSSSTLTASTLKAGEQCSKKDKRGRQVCFGKQLSKDKAPKKVARAMANAEATAGVEWCSTDFSSILATRFTECDVRTVPVIIRTDGVPDAIAYFMFLRMLQLDGQNSFTEHLTIEPAQQIPMDFAEIDMSINQHLCQGSCTPVEPDDSAWTDKTWWTPGDMHSTSVTTPYTWDASTPDQKYLWRFPSVVATT